MEVHFVIIMVSCLEANAKMQILVELGIGLERSVFGGGLDRRTADLGPSISGGSRDSGTDGGGQDTEILEQDVIIHGCGRANDGLGRGIRIDEAACRGVPAVASSLASTSNIRHGCSGS